MNVYRLCKCRYARDLSGRRANIAGDRWNSKDIPILYTARSMALSIV
ncbi:MAG: RES family NAD+ phosphorylase [Bacteroidales bacterium]|nr:RES family NAD+ phosphorylase [Bacteroidales bacterium]